MKLEVFICFMVAVVTWGQQLPTPGPEVAALLDLPDELNLAWSIAQARVMASGQWQSESLHVISYRHKPTSALGYVDALYANQSIGGLDVWLFGVFSVMVPFDTFWKAIRILIDLSIGPCSKWSITLIE